MAAPWQADYKAVRHLSNGVNASHWLCDTQTQPLTQTTSPDSLSGPAYLARCRHRGPIRDRCGTGKANEIGGAWGPEWHAGHDHDLVAWAGRS